MEEKNSTKLPSQPVQNQNVSKICTRNGKEVDFIVKDKDKCVKKVLGDDVEKMDEVEKTVEGDKSTPIQVEDEKQEEEPQLPPIGSPVYEPRAPFPLALKETKKLDNDKDIFETFLRCKVNIPSLDLLKSVPKYAKFLKEIYTLKRNNKTKSKVRVSEHVSAIFQKKMPPKCSDPGMFTIPCTIGGTKIHNDMLDLGASINVMPYSLYESLKFGPLRETTIVIQLADRSNTYSK